MSPQMVSDSTREDLASAYRKASGPFAITMDDQPDLVVMSSADIDLNEAPLTEPNHPFFLPAMPQLNAARLYVHATPSKT